MVEAAGFEIALVLYIIIIILLAGQIGRGREGKWGDGFGKVWEFLKKTEREENLHVCIYVKTHLHKQSKHSSYTLFHKGLHKEDN